MIINLKGNEGTLNNGTNGNTFFGSTCIKVSVTANVVIAIFDSDNTQLGNTTLYTSGAAPVTYFVQKNASDKIKLVSGTAPATPVGFTIS